MRPLCASDPIGLIQIEAPLGDSVGLTLSPDPEATLAGYLTHLARPSAAVASGDGCRPRAKVPASRWGRRPRRFWSLSNQVPADLGRLAAELETVCATTRRRMAAR
jgi:hypothetical protein